MAEESVVTITKFDEHLENVTLSFVNNDESFFDLPDLPVNATIMAARFNATGIPRAITYEDKMDFTTDAVGADLWARHKEGTGIYPVSVDMYNNSWAAIPTAQVANVKSVDGNYWHTKTSSYTNSTPWEYPVQLYHFRHDAKNVSEWEITWKGLGTCTANSTAKHGIEVWVLWHSSDTWRLMGRSTSNYGTNSWLNVTMESNRGFVAANGSMDVAIVGPHAIKNGTSTDYGHIYTDYMGMIAHVNTTQVEYPEDVKLWWGGYHLQISNGPLDSTVEVGDSFGLKAAIQATLDAAAQNPWGNGNCSISIDVYVKDKTRGMLFLHDLYIKYSIDLPETPNLPPKWIGNAVVTTEEDSEWTAVMDLDASFTDDRDQGDLSFIIDNVNPSAKLDVRLGQAPGGNTTLEVKPAPDFSGDVTVTMTATDSNSSVTASPPVTVHVIPVPDEPHLVDPGRLTAYEDLPFKVTISVIDPDLPDDRPRDGHHRVDSLE
jgi:hypothetical protein